MAQAPNHTKAVFMALDATLFVGIVNLIAGLLILLIPSMLRILVGGYLLFAGAIMVIVYFF